MAMNKMTRRNLKLITVLLILWVYLNTSTKVVEARRWVADQSEVEWTIDDSMVCRDGVIVMAYDIQSSEPPNSPLINPIDPYPYSFQARLFSTIDVSEPKNSGVSDFAEVYGPALTTHNSFTLDYHLDANGNYIPFFPEKGGLSDYYLYLVEELTWSRSLDVGTKIVVDTGFYDSDGFDYILAGVVGDCYLNEFEVTQWGVATITADYLNSALGPISSANIVYQIEQLPIFGTLYLNDLELAVGDAFTQDDVDNNLLTYSHNGDELESDMFVFSVRGTSRASTSFNNEQANGPSSNPAISRDGSIVAFASNASNLVMNDQSNFSDIFLRINDSETKRVSSTESNEANGDSWNPAIIGSSWGAISTFNVLFETDADNIEYSSFTESCPDTNNKRDIYSASSYNITRISVDEGCIEGNDNSYSPSVAGSVFGPFVVFETELTNWEEDANEALDIIEMDLSSGTIVSRSSGNELGNNDSSSPSISEYGDITFQSLASNLVMSDTNGLSDIFLRSGFSTTRISLGMNGEEPNGASVNPDVSGSNFDPEFSNRYVVYESDATNLIENDTNNARDIFLFDQETGFTIRVSVASDGSEANGDSTNATISANGRYVAFFSSASNLVSNDDNESGDIYIRDLQTGITKIVSIAGDGTLGNDSSYSPSISNDGDYIAFHSDASNLVSDDTNGVQDVFVHYVGYSDDFHIKVNLLHEKTFIPVVQKNFVNGPDLVISNLSLSNNNIEITLQNIGYSPVRSGFWVDLYISPDITPTEVNQIWQNLGDHGAVWGVDDDSFLLNAGETITLKFDDKYYFSGLSNLPNLIASGTAIYAQVDSANANTNYGAVLETHEMVNGQYNNIISVILTSPIILARPEPYISPIYLEKELPQRQHGVRP